MFSSRDHLPWIAGALKDKPSPVTLFPVEARLTAGMPFQTRFACVVGSKAHLIHELAVAV